MRKSELKIITNSKNLASYIILITESSPKKYRYLYIDKMHECILFIIEYLYKANDTILGDKQRLIYQENGTSSQKIEIDAIAFAHKMMLDHFRLKTVLPSSIREHVNLKLL